MDDPTAGLRARLTRPGRSAPGKDVNLPLEGSVVPASKRPVKPDVLGAVSKAAEGFKAVRKLATPSPSRGGR